MSETPLSDQATIPVVDKQEDMVDLVGDEKQGTEGLVNDEKEMREEASDKIEETEDSKEINEINEQINEINETKEQTDKEINEQTDKDITTDADNIETAKDQGTDIHPLSDDDIQLNSSDGEISDSDSSDSEDSSSDSESEDDDKLSENEDNEDDKITGPIVSKNEILNEVAPSLPEGYELGDKPIEPLGEITGFVDNSIIVKGNISAEFRVLKENSILCLKDQVLGPLFEIFGNLKTPIYRIKFNDSTQDTEKYASLKAFKGHQVYYVVPDSEFIFTDSIKMVKGSDASNFNDEEIPEDEQEFSDDEKEMAAKQRKRKNKAKPEKRKGDNKTKSGAQQPSKYRKSDDSASYPQQFTSYNLPTPESTLPPIPHIPQQAQQAQQPQQAPQQPQQAQQFTPYNQPSNTNGHFQSNSYGQSHNPYGPPYQSSNPPYNPYNNQYNPNPYYNQYNQPGHSQPGHFNQPAQYNQPGQFNQHNQFNQPAQFNQPNQYQPNQVNHQPNQFQDQTLNTALANASPEQLRLLEQLLKNQLNK